MRLPDPICLLSAIRGWLLGMWWQGIPITGHELADELILTDCIV